MSRGKTVLLVDSDLAALTVYSEGLQRDGFRVHTAEDGGEAMLQLAALPIDIVVMAAVLPAFSGLEVLKRMREDDVLQDVPAVILTDTSTQARTDLNGTNRFLLRKDASLSGLLNAIHEIVADRPEKKKAAKRKAAHGNSDMATSNPLTTAAVGLETLEASAESAALLKKAAAALPKVREDCLGYVKAPNTPASQQHLASLFKRIQTLEEHAEVSETGCVATLARPFGALLNSLASKALDPGPSILQTLTQAVDCLALVVDHGNDNVLDSCLKPQALVVDDDPISGDVNVTALQQANFDTTCIEDPLTALNILAGTPFDLIVLDVNMPKMTGFELCEKLRQLPQGKTTPVIFLTAFNNFENRKKSVLSGGGDFITKPVSTRELALKGTIHLLKAQIRAAKDNGASNTAQFIADPRTPSSAPRPLEASALLSTTESATSIVGNTEFLTVSPAITQPKELQKEKQVDSAKTPNNKQSDVASVTPPVTKTPPPALPSEVVSKDSLAGLEKERSELVRRAEKAESDIKEAQSCADKVKADLEQARASVDKQTARSDELEKQLAELQAAHKEILSKVSAGEMASEKSKNSVQELQTQLQQKSSELDRIQSDLAKAEAAVKERDDSYRLLEDELIALRKVRDQLQQKQQQATSELTRAKSDLAQQAAERARSDSELRAELAAAKQATSNAEASLKEKEEHYHLLEEELVPLRRTRDQFQQKQQQSVAEIERLKNELARESAERTKSESELRAQLEAAGQKVSNVESALNEITARSNDLEAELKSVVQQREALQSKHDTLADNLKQTEVRLSHETAERTKTELELKEANVRSTELEKVLLAAQQQHEQLEKLHQQSVVEYERIQAELARETADRAKIETEFRQQLEKANESLTRTESQLKEAVTRCETLESELQTIRRDFDLLQKQHQQSVAEFERARADLEKEIADRTKAEAELCKELEAANLKAIETEANLKEQEAKSITLEKDLASAGKAHDQLEKQFDQASNELKQTKAELEKESAQRAQLEKKLAAVEAKMAEAEQKLQESAVALEQTTSDLEKERKKHHRAEQRADALAGRLRGLHGELSKYLTEEPHSDAVE